MLGNCRVTFLWNTFWYQQETKNAKQLNSQNINLIKMKMFWKNFSSGNCDLELILKRWTITCNKYSKK